jgi:hypothetical protein
VSVMQRGNGRIICETLILLSMLNNTLSKSRDEIFIRGEGYNTLGVRLPLHLQSISIIISMSIGISYHMLHS